jgi:hypothetical protein
MRRRRTTLSLLGLLGLLLAPTGCKQSDSILVIYVAGPRSDEFVPVQLRVNVTAGSDGDTRSFLIPPVVAADPDTINLPASFTLALDRSHMGPIIVSIDALAANHQTVGSGTTMEDHIQIGGQTLISVMLTEGLPPDTQDAGAPSGSGGQGGISGAAGGAAGQGGASGSAGADARSLDGATD